MINQILLPNSTTFFIDQQVNYCQWLQSVNYHRDCFVKNDANVWLLYCEDAYQFSVLFFALLTANQKIILPQNGTVNQLQQSMQHAQGFTGHSEVDFPNSVSYCQQGNLPLTAPLGITPENEITLFTSGSSGNAKTVNKKFQHLLTEITQLESSYANEFTNTVVVSTVSHQHIYGLLFKLLWPIWFGRNVILQPYEYPEHLCHDVNKYDLERIILVSSPAHFHRVIKDNVYINIADCLHSCFSSGGALSLEASQQLEHDLGASPIEIYGSTETGGIAWRQRQGNQVCFWQPFNDVQVQRHPQSNCLMIKSPYFDCDGWYLADDQIQNKDHGKFDLCGRIDRIVKIEEKRVSLDHVQQSVKALSYIEDVYCLTKTNKRGLQVVAVIVLTEESKEQLAQSRNLFFNRKIRSDLATELETIAIPKRFRYLASLPYNSSGKLSKQAMEAFFD